MYIRFITIITIDYIKHNERLLIIFAWSFVKISNNRAQSSKIKLHKEACRRNLYTIQKEKERNKDSRLTGFPTTKRNHRTSRLTFSKGRSGLSVATCSPETLIRLQADEWVGSGGGRWILRQSYDTIRSRNRLSYECGSVYTYFVATRKSRTRGNNFKIIGSISRNEQFIYI